MGDNPSDLIKVKLLNIGQGVGEALGWWPSAQLDLLVANVTQMIAQHQTGEAMGLSAHEPVTCGTQHLIAERALRILGGGRGDLTIEAIEAVHSLCGDAGVGFARTALIDEIPF